MIFVDDLFSAMYRFNRFIVFMQKLFSSSLAGISGNLVEVEVDVVTGMGNFTIV